MRLRCFAGRDYLVLIVFASLVAPFLIPAIIPPGGCIANGRTRCRNNLRQLYQLGTVHAHQHQGQWPEAGDENLWVVFTRMKPPLISPDEVDILRCPVLDEDLQPGESHYLAPKVPWSKLGPNDPIAADRPGNHGDQEGRCVLLKSGNVVEIHRGDRLWRRCEEVLR